VNLVALSKDQGVAEEFLLIFLLVLKNTEKSQLLHPKNKGLIAANQRQQLEILSHQKGLK
jgi:hypothetical protein